MAISNQRKPNTKKRPFSGIRWNAVFARSTVGPRFFFVRNVYVLRRRKKLSAISLIFRGLDDCQVPTDFRIAGGPGSSICPIIHNYAFLDGGFISISGDGIGGANGSWVFGFSALRLMCYRLGVIQPRKLKGETSVLTAEELEDKLSRQLNNDRKQLERRLDQLLTASRWGYKQTLGTEYARICGWDN